MSKSRILNLKFRAVNRDIFEAIRSGRKKVGTRSATKKYKKVKVGDKLMFVCKFKKFEKVVKKVTIFKTIRALVNKYKPSQINPCCKTEAELRDMYYTFPGYKDKIKKFGLIAFELK
jgi:ASC-1-like (ASCH) protein